MDDIGGRGRCLRATRDFARGELALSSAARVPWRRPRRRAAAGRFERSAPRRSDARRVAARVCSRLQRRSWIALRRRECGAVASSTARPCAGLLLPRALARRAPRPHPPRRARTRRRRRNTRGTSRSEPLKTTTPPLRPSVADVHAMHRWFRRSTRAGANEGAHIATRVHEGAPRRRRRPERDRDEEDAVSAAETVRRAPPSVSSPRRPNGSTTTMRRTSGRTTPAPTPRTPARGRRRDLLVGARRVRAAVMDPLPVPLAAAAPPRRVTQPQLRSELRGVVSFARAERPRDAGARGRRDGGVPGGEWIQAPRRCAPTPSRGEPSSRTRTWTRPRPPWNAAEALSRRYGLCATARGVPRVPRGCRGGPTFVPRVPTRGARFSAILRASRRASVVGRGGGGGGVGRRAARRRRRDSPPRRTRA